MLYLNDYKANVYLVVETLLFDKQKTTPTSLALREESIPEIRQENLNHLENKTKEFQKGLVFRRDRQLFIQVHRGVFWLGMGIGSIHVWSYFYWAGLVLLLMTIGFAIYSRIRLKEEIVYLLEMKPAEGQSFSSSIEIAKAHLNYLNAGLVLKELRLTILQIETSFLLPLLFICGTELLLHKVGVYEISFAVLIGLLTWFFLWQKDFEWVYEQDDHLKELSRQLDFI